MCDEMEARSVALVGVVQRLALRQALTDVYYHHAEAASIVWGGYSGAIND